MPVVCNKVTPEWPASSILLTVLLFSLLAIATGCRGPACGPGGCSGAYVCPPSAYCVTPHGRPHHYIEHLTKPAPQQYAEPQWPYYDQSGTPRIMGDTRLRSHLGVPATPGEVIE